MIVGNNGTHRVEPEDMTQEEREIAIFKMVRLRAEGDGEIYQLLGANMRETATNTMAIRDLTSAIRAGRPLSSQPPPPVVATVFPPSRDKQQSSMDLDAIAKQAAMLLDVDSEAGENTKVTQITEKAQILNGMIESAKVNAYNRAASTARLKLIAVWIGIIGGGIPIVIAVAALLLWVLKTALIYLKLTPG